MAKSRYRGKQARTIPLTVVTFFSVTMMDFFESCIRGIIDLIKGQLSQIGNRNGEAKVNGFRWVSTLN
jgi:hypothetical protein